MRLIVKYSVGDNCTYSFDVIKPLVYSSKEDAIIDFGSKIIEMMESKKSFMKNYCQWENRLASISSSNIEKRALVFKDRPEEPSYNFNLGGCIFYLSDFVSQDYDSKKESIIEPEFYTVDEWFSKAER